MRHQNFIRNIAKGLLFSYFVTAVLLLVIALFLWKWNIGVKVISGGMIAIYVLSSLVGGLYLGKKQRERKFLWGILMGVLYIFILLFAAVLTHGMAGVWGKETIFAMFICILSGMLGGMVA